MPQSGWTPRRPAQLPPVAATQRPLHPVPSLSFWLSGCCSEWLDCATLMGHPRQQAAQQVRRQGRAPCRRRAFPPLPVPSSPSLTPPRPPQQPPQSTAAAARGCSAPQPGGAASVGAVGRCGGSAQGSQGNLCMAHPPCTACEQLSTLAQPAHGTHIHQRPSYSRSPPHLLHKQ